MSEKIECWCCRTKKDSEEFSEGKSSCKECNESLPEHSCPFDQEIGDGTQLCTCSRVGMYDCCMDI